MKGDPQVIAALKQAASMEAGLCAQYRLDARDLKHLGAKCLKRKFACFEDDCDDWLEEILDRVLFLEGDAGYSTDGATSAATVTELFQRALAAETALCQHYQELCVIAQDARDDNSRNKAEHWIKWHEDDHIDWLEKQLAMIARFGEDEYLLEAM